jgi:hypothetical protein
MFPYFLVIFKYKVIKLKSICATFMLRGKYGKTPL